jgi:D-glycero-D-manno-heptose 1,7-bisphosphate phosphatase
MTPSPSIASEGKNRSPGVAKWVILDRDGTINADRDDYVKSVEEWVPLEHALQAIAKLNHAGWRVVIVSNQSGLGRGLFDVATLNAMHEKMNKLLAQEGGRVEAIFYCPHTKDDACECRKPLSGLYEQIKTRLGLDLSGVPSVGDSLRDLQAAVAVGCEPHLVLTGKAEVFKTQALSPQFPHNTRVHKDLLAFANWLLHERERAMA